MVQVQRKFSLVYKSFENFRPSHQSFFSMPLSVLRVRRLLDELRKILVISWLQYNSPMNLGSVIPHLSDSSRDSLTLMLQWFIRIVMSEAWFKDLPDQPIDVWGEEFESFRLTFFALLLIIIYIRYSVVSPVLGAMGFLLRYRHLANTGFHLVHSFGLGPCVRVIPKILEQARKHFLPQSDTGVIWCDNVRRESKGRLRSDYPFDHTVYGMIPVGQLPNLHPGRCQINRFTKEAETLLVSRLNLCDSRVKPLQLAEAVIDFEVMTVPLRHPGGQHYQFIGLSLSDFNVGSVDGTMRFMKYMMGNLKQNHYSVAVVDYDIYWRVMRTFHTSSFIGAFHKLSTQCFFLQAPWHIYKRLTEASWKYFAPLFLADVWLFAYERTCPASPRMVDMIPFYIVIRQLSKDFTGWSKSKSSFHAGIGFFLETILPLVSTSRHIFAHCLLISLESGSWIRNVHPYL